MSNALLPLLVTVEVIYGTACGIFGARPGAPLWLRWPLPIWNFIRHGRPPKPRPNYARIARLERELGMVEQEPERPVRTGRAVCLAKNCAGDTVDIRTWGGELATRIHTCG